MITMVVKCPEDTLSPWTPPACDSYSLCPHFLMVPEPWIVVVTQLFHVWLSSLHPAS